MRQGQQQQQKRMRGRNNNNNNNNNNRKGPNPLSRTYESNGPDVKIRGTAAHIADKYVQLYRDAQSSGDPVAAENYLQHAEHYYRILAAAQPQFQQHPGFIRADDEAREEDFEDEGGEGQANGYENQMPMEGRQPNGQQPQQQHMNAPQPFVPNGQREGGQRDNGYREGQREGGQREGGQRDNQRNGGQRGEYQPRQPQPQPQPQPQVQPAQISSEVEVGLPAFITGGQPVAQPFEAPQTEGEGGEGEARVGGRRRRRFGRYGRAGGPDAGGPDGAPSDGVSTPEPEVAPGE